MRANHVRNKGILHVPEGRGVFPGLSVAENLEVMLQRDRGQIETAFSQFPRLRDRRNQIAGSLSGGEQQMLALAPAVAGSHRLVLADEVSLGLAPVIVDELFDVLASLRDQGVAMIIVEQFADRALGLADQVLVMRKGQIVYRGTPDSLARDPDLLHELYMGAAA